MRKNIEWRAYAKKNGIELCPREFNKYYRAHTKGNKANWLTKTYSRVKRDMKNKFGQELDFTKAELGIWAEQHGLEVLLAQYKASGFQKDFNPSVDRIDDYKGYTFDNIQLVTWKQNNARGRKSRKNKEQCSKMAKAVWSKRTEQRDAISGALISTFCSTHEAQRKTGIDSSLIARACRKGVIAKGYRWNYV